MRWTEHRGFLAVLAVVVVAHGAVLVAAPDRKLFGDETGYLERAFEDAESGRTSLLPGTLRYDWRPELVSRFYAQFVGEGARRTEVVRAIGWAQLALFAGVLALVYAHGRSLGLRRGATVATALLGAFPWFGFYVHALWPEVLHALLFGAALFGLQRFLAGRGLANLAWGGAAIGFALLTKGAVNPLLPVLVVFLAAVVFVRRAPRPALERAGAAAMAAAVFVAPALLVVVPQVVANARVSGRYEVASNRWINVELGLMRPLRHEDPDGGAKIYRRYFADQRAGRDAEAASRRRVLDYVRERPLTQVVGRQLARSSEMLFHSTAFLERAAAPGTWTASGDAPRLAGAIGRVFFYALLLAGVAGAVALARLSALSAGWVLLGGVLAYFAAATFALPLKTRFLMPLVPVLCLFAGGLWETAARRRREPQAPAPTP